MEVFTVDKTTRSAFQFMEKMKKKALTLTSAILPTVASFVFFNDGNMDSP